jgi:hypothetical protein
VIRGAFLDVLPGEDAKRAGKAPGTANTIPERQGPIQRYARKITGSIASAAVGATSDHDVPATDCHVNVTSCHLSLTGFRSQRQNPSGHDTAGLAKRNLSEAHLIELGTIIALANGYMGDAYCRHPTHPLAWSRAR